MTINGVMKKTAGGRLVDAAFELFAERGYEQTTVDDIAERAKVSRTTFFRTYRSKEDVIFPPHDQLMAAVRQRLATSNDSTAIVAVSDAVRLVLLRYIEEGERARLRYAITSKVAVLRDREIATAAQYQRLFRDFITNWMGPSEHSALRAELMAAAVVAAHNHVLRRWLRRDTLEPLREIDAAMDEVIALFTPTVAPEIYKDDERQGETTVIVFQSSHKLSEVVPALQRTIDDL